MNFILLDNLSNILVFGPIKLMPLFSFFFIEKDKETTDILLNFLDKLLAIIKKFFSTPPISTIGMNKIIFFFIYLNFENYLVRP